jgi:hypothetical protein
VIDMSAYFSDWTAATAQALAGRVGQYVFISSGAVPARSRAPWSESTPLGPNPIWGGYGREGRLGGSALGGPCRRKLRRHDSSPALHPRPGISPTGSRSCSAGCTGSADPAPRWRTAVNQFVYADDVARALVATLERPTAAAGQVYNCTHQPVITNRGWVELCADVLGVEARIVPVDEAELGVASDVVDLTNIVFPYPAEHYAIDGAKLSRELGVEMTTGNRRMIEEYAGWWELLDPKPELRSYERENTALAALGLPQV